jgi:hypothetical protein
MDNFVVSQEREAANVYVHIVQGKENEATPAQLKKIFGSRYKQDTVFQQSWVDDRTKNNPHEVYAFVLGVKGTNKQYIYKILYLFQQHKCECREVWILSTQ